MSQVALLSYSLFLLKLALRILKGNDTNKMKVGEDSLHYCDHCACGCFVHSRLIITNEVAIGAKEGVHQEEAIVERVEFSSCVEKFYTFSRPQEV